jgi:hypothetical protein
MAFDGAPFPIYSPKFMRSSVDSLMGNGNAFFAVYGDRAISKTVETKTHTKEAFWRD